MMRIQSVGKLWWSQPFVLQTFCECDPTYYPFDKQTCAITLSTWSYAQIEVDLVFNFNPVQLDFYQENGEWEYVSYSKSLTTELRDGRFYKLSNVYFTFRRRPQFALMNTIVPIVLFAFLSCLTFYVSIESGEKIGYCLTVLLSYAVYLTLVSESMPTTSVRTSILSKYALIIFYFYN